MGKCIQKRIMRAFVFLALFSLAFAVKRFDGDQVLTFTPTTEEQVEIIRSFERAEDALDFWRPDSAAQVKVGSKVDLRVPRENLAAIKADLKFHGMDFDIKIFDVQATIEETLDTARGIFDKDYDYNKYHTYDEIMQWADDMASEYPSLARTTVMGQSTEGRDIKMITIGSSTTNKQVVVDCGIHAREWISPAFCQCYVHRLLSSYGSDASITAMLDQVTFAIMPLLNPDGYAYTQTDRMWRKTRSRAPGTRCYGVDPNRNFDADWAGPGASSSPCSETYYGPSLASEPLTQYLTKYIDDNVGNVKAYVTFHSYGQVFIFPYSYAYESAANYDEHNDLAAASAAAIQAVHGKAYTYGPGWESMYLAAGGSDDMSYDHGSKLAFTIELRDQGRYGFLLPENQIQPSCEETYAGMDVIVQHVMDTY